MIDFGREGERGEWPRSFECENQDREAQSLAKSCTESSAASARWGGTAEHLVA